MATGGDKKQVSGNVSDGNMTQEEIDQLVKTLSAMKVKPKADSPEDLLSWMQRMVGTKSEVQVPEHPVIKTEASSVSKVSKEDSIPYKQPIRISIFSGDGKGETSYELWRYEVMCLMREGHSKESILMAIRRSLKGEPANILMRLGSIDIIEEILHKFDSIYGNVMEAEDILAEFYSAKQRDDENCAAWSVRLEDLVTKAVRKGKVSPTLTNDMLRTMFYKGLREDLKDISGHLYHNTYDFDRLRVAIRKIELEHKPVAKPSKHATAKAATCTSTSDTSADRFSEMQSQLDQLTAQVMQLSQNPQTSQYSQMPRQSYQRGRRAFRGYRTSQSPRMPSAPLPANDVNPAPSAVQQDKVICYRCHQEGHIAVGCRVRLDHQKAQHLNFNRSNPGARGLAAPRQGPLTRRQ